MEPHQPVLHDQVLEVLAPQEGERFADLTAGYGGHAASLLAAVGPSGHGYLFDRDQRAVEFLRLKFAGTSNLTITRANFAGIVFGADVPPVDMILLDLGVSSPQLDDPRRGFSFSHDGPLDMRADQRQSLTAAQLVNNASAAKLTDILYRYGQEPQARRIAAAIEQARKTKPIATTAQLVDIVSRAVPRRGRLHPATKTFQALRIAVNGELDNLQSVLPKLADGLKPGGRLAVISFHSLEDRLVKQHFRELSTAQLDHRGQVSVPARFHLVTKSAVKGEDYDHFPRARSARLRAVAKN